jgi:signal transduction histidine kinase
MHTHSGAGLGLALVKEWIQEMGGTVAVESAVGEGSCFSLHLPRECGEYPRTDR